MSRTLADRIGITALWISLALSAAPLLAQDGAGRPDNPFLKWLWVVLGLVLIWLMFYKGLYPFLLRHFSHDASKAIFWPLFLLYAMTWLHLTAYIFFVYGFYFFWMRVAALFLATLFAIWFLISLLRRA